MSKILIRPALQADCTGINAIFNESVMLPFANAFSNEMTVEEHEQWLDAKEESGHDVIVAESEETIIGYAFLSAYRGDRKALDGNKEMSYYVHKDFESQGIASKLIKAIEALAEERSISNLLTFIIEGNAASIHLMHKFNYQAWGRLPAAVKVGDSYKDHLIFGKQRTR